MSSLFLFLHCATALLLLCVSDSLVTVCEAKYSDDGKGVLLHDMLSQPFRVSLLRGSEGLSYTSAVATPAAKGQSSAGQEAISPIPVVEEEWYKDVGFALAPDEANPYEDETHVSGLRVNKPKYNLISPIFSHPRRRKHHAVEELQQQQEKGAVKRPKSENPNRQQHRESFLTSKGIEPPERFTLKVGIGKYDGLDLARARRVKRETMKATSHLSNSRYGEIRDTSLIVGLYDEFSVGSSSFSSSASPSSRLVLSLSTLDPYLPFTKALLGGRIGAVTQAQRYESTGHSELEGLMSADKMFWNSLRSAEVSSTSDGPNKHKEGEEEKNGSRGKHEEEHQHDSDDDLVHGTFTLTFLNRQEFTLKLKALPSATTIANGNDGESEAFENSVVFYGFATPPILPSRATVYSTVSAMLGLHGGSASSFLSSATPQVSASAETPAEDAQLSSQVDVPTATSDTTNSLLLSSVLRSIYSTLFFDGRVTCLTPRRQAERQQERSVFAGLGLQVPDGAALLDKLSSVASLFSRASDPDSGQEQGHQRANTHTYARPLPAAYFPSMIDRAFDFAVRALATPFARSLPQAGDQKNDDATAGRNKESVKAVDGVEAELEQRVTPEEAEEESRLLVRSLSKLSSWCYDKWPLLFALSSLVALKILADIIEWGKNRRVRKEKEARERTQRESDERLALLLGEPLKFAKK